MSVGGKLLTQVALQARPARVEKTRNLESALSSTVQSPTQNIGDLPYRDPVAVSQTVYRQQTAHDYHGDSLDLAQLQA
jgi:hypothetical protein